MNISRPFGGVCSPARATPWRAARRAGERADVARGIETPRARTDGSARALRAAQRAAGEGAAVAHVGAGGAG